MRKAQVLVHVRVVHGKIPDKQLSNSKRNELHVCVACGPLRVRKLKKEPEEHHFD